MIGTLSSPLGWEPLDYIDIVFFSFRGFVCQSVFGGSSQAGSLYKMETIIVLKR
jgi:hypothetical protein